MKIKMVISFFLLTLLCLCRAYSTEPARDEPPKLTKMRKDYEEQVKNALKQLAIKYEKNLKSLEDWFTSTGDTAGALSVKAEREHIMKGFSIPGSDASKTAFPFAKRRLLNAKLQQRYNRIDALKQGGGSDKTEWSVLIALRWLKKNQNDDGSWGKSPYKPAMTAFALLAYLGHGEDYLSLDFGGTVQTATTWLISQQDEDGYFSESMRAYQHAIVTYALTEAYAMSGREDLQPVLDKALRKIIEGQTSLGGWRYTYVTTGKNVEDLNDLSVTGWQIQALKAAHGAGINYPDGTLQRALGLAAKYVQNNFNTKTHVFGYMDTSGTWQDNYAMTAAGTLCMQLLGMYNAKEVKSALDQMKKNYKCDWEETVGGRLNAPLYAWYYVTQAFYQATDTPSTNPYWLYWNRQMQMTLFNNQNINGSWYLPEKSNEKNHLGNEQENADIYSTAMCCIMLEIYYRYPPTYKFVQ